MIDLIVCNPAHLVYPLWNQFLKDNRSRFGQVIICLTDMGTTHADYKEYLKSFLSNYDVKFLEIPRAESGQDWRNEAIHEALKVSTGEWVFFSEQDFIITNPIEFWDVVEDYMKLGEAGAIGYFQGERLHPCCLFVKRFILDNFTRKDFGVIKDTGDHFCKIQQDLEKAFEENEDITLYDLDEAQLAGWCYHLNGLSQNLYMLQIGEEPNYDIPSFKKYCQDCLALPDLHQDFRELFEYYLEE